MIRGGWILLIGAAGLAAVVAATATRQRARSPEEDLSAVTDRLRRGRLDREEALSELDRLVDRTSGSSDAGVAARARLTRGRILLDIDALDRAREDLQVVLDLKALSPTESREVEDDLIDLDVRAGKFLQGLDRVKAQIDRDPADAAAWARKGELHRGVAERALQKGRETIANRLLADAAERARDLLDELGTMDPMDPRRPAIGRDLAALFDAGDESAAQLVLRAADQAAHDHEQARIAWATSLSDLALRGGRRSAAASLIEILDRAGRPAEAAGLGTCALRRLQKEGDADAVARIVGALDRLGRKTYASDLGKWLVDRDAPIAPSRLLSLCDLFYRAGRWSELRGAANRLAQIGNEGEVAKAGLYEGLAQVHLGDASGGKYALEKWIARDEPEPFDGARAEVWRRIADAAQRLRLPDDEADALENAVRADPEHAGPSLLRLSNLAIGSAHGGYRLPEERWAKAMNLMPERTDELVRRWKRIGDLELKSDGLPRSGVLRDPGWRKILNAPNYASPYALWFLADALLDAGQPAQADPLVRQLLQSLPRFVPGLDLSIRVQLGLGRPEDALPPLLARMRTAGADSGSRAILSRLPLERISAETRQQLMAADPEGFGRREIARGFLREGEPELALALVGDAEGPNSLLEARLVAARACLDIDAPDRAYELLLPLGRHVSSSAEAFELFARAAVRTGHRDDLLRATKRAASGLVPRKPSWLALCDTLLALGDAPAAMPLVRRLDADRRTRGGDVLLRRAWAELLLGDEAGLRRTLDRAAAFDTRGEVELVGVFAASCEADGSALPAAVDALRKTSWKPTRLQQAALLGLGGKPKAARELIDAVLSAEAAPLDPSWSLADALLAAQEGKDPRPIPETLGAEAGPETARLVASAVAGDARELWSLLLAQDSAAAAAWVAWRGTSADRLAGGAEDGQGAGLWSGWIAARLARAAGDAQAERRALERLLSGFPAFVPAWDRLEDLLVRGRASKERLEDLRERRLHALGPRAGTAAEVDLAIARLQRKDGQLDLALETASKALEEDPGLPEIRAELGRIRAARGEWKEAVAESVRASRMESAASDAASAGDLIRALAGAGAGSPPALGDETRRAELEALERRASDDPRVPVALAWMDLETEPRSPVLAVSRAYARLDRFLDAHKSVALESLCPGADAAWTDLLVALDPRRARDLLRRERMRSPASLAPWLQLGRVDAAEVKPALEARRAEREPDELDLVRRMAPIPRVLREHARARLSRGPSQGEIFAMAGDIRRAEGRPELDGELSFLVARALFDLGPRGTKAAQRAAAHLGSEADLPPPIAAAADVLGAEIRIALGSPADAAEAARILDAAESYRTTLLTACRSLVRGMPALPER
jgi:tetratricopeptide (TPR) repeat protein